MTGLVHSMAEHPGGEVRIDGLLVRSDDAVALTPLPPVRGPVDDDVRQRRRAKAGSSRREEPRLSRRDGSRSPR